jgi:hypothetical protein
MTFLCPDMESCQKLIWKFIFCYVVITLLVTVINTGVKKKCIYFKSDVGSTEEDIEYN